MPIKDYKVNSLSLPAPKCKYAINQKYLTHIFDILPINSLHFKLYVKL